jgi:hypothetical protein
LRGSDLQKAFARLTAIAGPKGGVGRSTCAVALARALVIRERCVLLVEFCSFGSELSTLLDMPELAPQSAENFTPAPSPLNGLDILCLSANSLECDAWTNLYENLRQLKYDDVVLDLRSGLDALSTKVFLCADLPILISDPEPGCLKLTMKWLEQAICTHVRALSPALLGDISSWPFIQTYAQLPAAQQSELLKVLGRFRCAFLLNRRREQSEALQCHALCHALGMMLGIYVTPLGTLSADDRRWFYARRMADVSLFVREDPLVRELEAILRENMPSFEHSVCLPILDAKLQPLELLRVKTPGMARAAYRQLWEGYKRENGLVSAVMPRQIVMHTIQLLEIAHRNAETGNTIDSSAGLSQPNAHSGGLHTSNEPPRHHSGSIVRTGGKISPTDCSRDAGLWLQNQRKDQNLTLSQLAMKTRIPQRVLEHIEALTFEPMAATRFTAYLFEIARGLNIPADDVKQKFGV